MNIKCHFYLAFAVLVAAAGCATPDGRSDAGAVHEDGKFCNKLTAVLEAERRDARKLRGRRNDAGDYEGMIEIPGTQGCAVWARDNRYHCTVSQKETDSQSSETYERARREIRECLGASWQATELQLANKDPRSAFLHRQSGLQVRLDMKRGTASHVTLTVIP